MIRILTNNTPKLTTVTTSASTLTRHRTAPRSRGETLRWDVPVYTIMPTTRKIRQTHLTIQIQEGPFQQVKIRLGDFKIVKGGLLNLEYRILRLPKSYPKTIEVVTQKIIPTLQHIVYNMVVNAVAKAEQVIAKSNRANK